MNKVIITNLKLITVFLVFISLSASCATEKKENVVKKFSYKPLAGQYMPLAIGNSWTYSVNYMGKKGTTTVYIKNENNGWFTDNMGNEITVDSSGIRDRNRYLLTFPLKEEKEWSNVVSVSQSESRKIISLDSEITVPAGKFQGAIVVETKTPVKKGITLNSVTYFVKNIGIVRIETFLEDTQNGKIYPQTATALKSFEIKNVKP